MPARTCSIPVGTCSVPARTISVYLIVLVLGPGWVVVMMLGPERERHQACVVRVMSGPQATHT